MAEEHGVGDRAEEGGTDERAGHRQAVAAAGVEAGGDEADQADDRRRIEVDGTRREGPRVRDGSAASPG